MAYFAKTIQRKLLLVLLLVGLLPAFAGVLYMYWGTMFAINEAVGAYLEERASLVASSLDEQLQQFFQSAETARAQFDAGQPLSALHTPRRPDFDAYYIVDEVGARVDDDGSTVPRPAVAPNVLRRSWTPKDVFLDEVYSEPEGTWLLFICPLRQSSGRYLICSIASGSVLHFIAVRSTPGRALVDVFSNRGHFLNSSTRDDQYFHFVNTRYADMRQTLGGWVISSERGPEAFLLGYSVSKLLRLKQRETQTSVEWVVMAQMGLADVQELGRFLMWRTVLFAGVLVIGLVVLSAFLARRLIRPIRRLHANVERFASGDLSTRVVVQTGDEIENLAHAFNTMAAKIESSRLALEEQMRDTESKARQLALIGDIGRSVVAEFELQDLLDAAHSQLHNLVGYDALGLILFQESDSALVVTGTGQPFTGTPPDGRALRLFIEEELLTRANGSSLAIATSSIGVAKCLNPGCRQFCLLQLRTKQGLTGALVLGRVSDTPFEEPELRPLDQVSQIIALAIEHVVLFERIRNFASELERKVSERTAELGRAHEKLVQTERFAATGRLAANIAHEINNPLGIVNNYLRILSDTKLQASGAGEEALNVIREELDRIARIVRGLLDFYRPQRTPPAPVDINDEIRSLLGLMHGGLERRGISIVLNLDPSSPRPIVSPDHMRQVLLNLFKNAEDALGDGGTITVRTAAEQVDGALSVILQISDTGSGMSEEVRSHAFEPFFTTKHGEGTGLGLPVTFGIVTSYGGTIDIESASGTGTTVTVRLPAVATEPLPARSRD